MRKAVAGLICLFLLTIICLLLGKEYLYLQDANTHQAFSHDALPPGWPAERDLSALGLKSMDGPAFWNEATLADKINGKAELYLGAGLAGMTSARFALAAAPGQWFEAQIFAMKTENGAFAVFSQQRRSQGRPLSWARQAYGTQNAFYIQQGRYYVEITGTAADNLLLAGMEAWGQKWLAGQEANNFSPQNIFTGPGLMADSVMLLAQDAFGIPGFDQVWVAEYAVDGQVFMLFVRDYSQHAAALAQQRQVEDFWVMLGAETIADEPENLPGLKVFALDGFYQLLLVRDGFLLGVHEASIQTTAEKLLDGLSEYLRNR